MKYLTCKNFKPSCLVPRLIKRVSELKWLPTVFTLKCDRCEEYDERIEGGKEN